MKFFTESCGKSCKRCNQAEVICPHRKLAIVGNLNVGKSTLFAQICGQETCSINVPGSTVTISRGRIPDTDVDVYDTPGIYSLFSHNEDERVSRDLLLCQDCGHAIEGILVIADAKNLKRSIAIALQFAEYGLPMLLDVNMIDEAQARGIEIDFDKLADILGVEVCTSVANEGIGVRRILARLGKMKSPGMLVEYPARIEHFLKLVGQLLPPGPISTRAIGLLMLVDDEKVWNYVENNFGPAMFSQLKSLVKDYQRQEPGDYHILLGNFFNTAAEQIIEQVQQIEPPSGKPLLLRFGDLCTRYSTGIPIAVVILGLMYLFVGSFAATFLVDTINGVLFDGYLIPWVNYLVEPIPSPFIRDMIIDPDFGVFPTGIALALGLVLPVLFCFYVAFGFLEDSGYLARISILLDKLFQLMGLNGKGVIPLVMGFSCVTMALFTTRILDTEKEKIIVTFLLLLGMPCAPLLAVMFIILNKMSISATFTVFGLIALQIVVAGMLANKILPGRRTPLLMEIPAMRLPKIGKVLKMSAMKTYFFMKEAIPVFVLASICVFIFDRVGGLEILERISKPIVHNLMGLPDKSVQVFIKTIIRRESGATEIEHLSAAYDNVQLVVNLLVMTFLTPCLNAIMVLIKERGSRVAMGILCAVMVYAIGIGAIVNHACRFLGVTFV